MQYLPVERSRSPIRVAIWAVVGCVLMQSVAAQAHTLEALWQAASQYAPEQHLAEAERDIAKEQGKQADIPWKPQVSAQIGLGVGGQRLDIAGAEFQAPGLGAIDGAEFKASALGGGVGQLQLQAEWPLYHPARQAQADEIRQTSALGELAYQQQHQKLLLTLATAYFQLALAQQEQQVLNKEQQSLQQQAEEACYRFKIGDSPVVDVHDAQARLSALEASQLSNQTDIQAQQLVLAQLTGLDAESITASLPQSLPVDVPGKDTLETSLSVQQQQAQQIIAKTRLRQYGPWADIQVSAVAKVQQDVAYQANSHLQQTQALVGVLARIPLFDGGRTTAKQAEALASLRLAEAQLEQTRSELMTRQHQGVLQLRSLMRQKQAIQQALVASRLHRDATHTGLSVGDRTAQDVLNAEQAVARLQIQDAQLTTQYLVLWLQLCAHNGQLTSQKLREFLGSCCVVAVEI